MLEIHRRIAKPSSSGVTRVRLVDIADALFPFQSFFRHRNIPTGFRVVQG
jgi:hypothetical protein